MKFKDLEYKGYIGKCHYDDEDRMFYGEVINTNDIISFKGSTVDELRQSFFDSVDAYLEFCDEFGKEPDKPFNGNILVRTSPETHRDLYVLARKNNTSLNGYVSSILQNHIELTDKDKHPSPVSKMFDQHKFIYIYHKTLYTSISEKPSSESIMPIIALQNN